MRRLALLRGLLAALALSAAVPGAWATLAPRGFYADFPGPTQWVALLPPFSAHLVADVGAFYLAFAALLAWAALRPEPALVRPVAAAWALFNALHTGWHVAHLEGFPVGDAIGQTAGFAVLLAATWAVARLARPPRRRAGVTRPARAATSG
jgi:hypothetical protein